MPDVPATFPRSRLEAPRPTGSGAVDAAAAIWDALAALGVGDVVLAPGSRSAPLVYALGEGQVARPRPPARRGGGGGAGRRPARGAPPQRREGIGVHGSGHLTT